MIKLTKEIDKRLVEEDNTYELIGSELKYQRLSLSKTLSSLAKHCSLSYICKIESNSIKPNAKILAELCEEVEIDSDKLETLQNLKDILIDMYRAYFFDDEEKLTEIYKKVESFNNYRAKIIRMFYYLKTNNLKLAQTESKELRKLVSSMSEFDLLAFVLVYAIYKSKKFEYDDAITGFKKVIEYKYIDDVLKALAYYNLVKCYYILDYYKFDDCLRDAFLISCDLLNFNMAKRLRFLSCCNKIRNNEKVETITFSDSRYDNTILLLTLIKNKEYDKISLDDIYLNEFFNTYAQAFKDRKRFKDTVKKLDLSKTPEIEYLYLYNMAMKDDSNRLIALNETLYPLALNIGDAYMIRSLGEELSVFYQTENKYKAATLTLTKELDTYKFK